MNVAFSDRIGKVQRSFIREMLTVTTNRDIISLAGGVPHPASFPVKAIAEAAARVLAESGPEALQYQPTEGYEPLREHVAARYRARWGLEVSPEEILITTGSQQGLDLLGKVFVNPGDRVILERPAYLGAIQALSLYEPQFVHVPMDGDGMDAGALSDALSARGAKMLYTVPNFQNPSGITYSVSRRAALAATVADWSLVVVEDDPYGELRFEGEASPPLRAYLGSPSVMMGSFSKIVSPGLRTGWICAPREVLDKLIVAKQAADLHTDSLSQRVLHRYLADNDIEAHVASIRERYRAQRDAMVAAIDSYCPPGSKRTHPQGGMFVWLTLPDGVSSVALFDRALEAGVAFVPGTPFHANGGGHDSMRLSYTTCDPERITEGIRRLGRVIDQALAKSDGG